MKKMKNKKRCYALAGYMEAAACSDDPRDRVAPCLEVAAQGLSYEFPILRVFAFLAEEYQAAEDEHVVMGLVKHSGFVAVDKYVHALDS